MPSKKHKSVKSKDDGGKDAKVSRLKKTVKGGRNAPAKRDDSDTDPNDGGEDLEESRFFSDGKDAMETRSPRRKRKVEDQEYQDDDEEPRRNGRKVYDSDALDEDSDFKNSGNDKKRKRKPTTRSSPKKARSPRKKRKVQEDEDAEDYEDDLPEGQEVVGKVVQAPKAGRVPPGQISLNTFNFLSDLKKPECNDRQWFKLNEPVYRQAEQEWKDFVESFTDVLMGVDSQIPHLPPKDVIHRIYRDMRFSNDKTPYKKGFSASFSRSGRKGIFAGYHVAVQPGHQSMIAAGSWCPGRNELATIRANILRNPRRLRRVISSPEFVKYFGKAEPHPKGEQQNIFGQEGELKTAPKGVDKDHADIDLLKCRSFCVVYRFPDGEALSPDFKDKLASVAKVLQPFVHCLNDMMTITSTDEDDGDEDGDEDDGDEDDEGEEGEGEGDDE